MIMDSQDTLALAEVMEDKKDFEDNENVIHFFALKHYLTHLTNNGGRLNRITKVTAMMNNLLPEVQTYLVDKMKGE
jgi:hypothetical protein